MYIVKGIVNEWPYEWHFPAKEDILPELTGSDYLFSKSGIADLWPEHPKNKRKCSYMDADPFEIWDAFDMGNGRFLLERTGGETVETWTDKETNLEWQVEPFSKNLSLVDAKEYAITLGNGWRLPTREELVEIAGSKKSEKLRGSGLFWSSTHNKRHKNYAWSVYSNHCIVQTNLILIKLRVRCVREANHEDVGP